MNLEDFDHDLDQAAYDADQLLFNGTDTNTHVRALPRRTADSTGQVQHEIFSYDYPSSVYQLSNSSIYGGDLYSDVSTVFSTTDSLFPYGSSNLGSTIESSSSAADYLSYSSHDHPWSSYETRFDSSHPSEQSSYSPHSISISDSYPNLSPLTLLGHEIHSEPQSLSNSLPLSTTCGSLALVESSSYTRDGQASVDLHESCPDCNKSFQRPSDLSRHMKIHQNPDFWCRFPDCSRGFRRKDKLRDHLRQAHGTEDVEGETKPALHTCSECAKVFRRQVDLNKHYNRIHNKRFRCQKCERSFGLHNDLQRHELTCYRKFTSQLSCDVEDCTFNTLRRDNLLRHKKKQHGIDASEKARALSEPARDT